MPRAPAVRLLRAGRALGADLPGRGAALARAGVPALGARRAVAGRVGLAPVQRRGAPLPADPRSLRRARLPGSRRGGAGSVHRPGGGPERGGGHVRGAGGGGKGRAGAAAAVGAGGRGGVDRRAGARARAHHPGRGGGAAPGGGGGAARAGGALGSPAVPRRGRPGAGPGAAPGGAGGGRLPRLARGVDGAVALRLEDGAGPALRPALRPEAGGDPALALAPARPLRRARPVVRPRAPLGPAEAPPRAVEAPDSRISPWRTRSPRSG